MIYEWTVRLVTTELIIEALNELSKQKWEIFTLIPYGLDAVMVQIIARRQR